jgi:hypothetical protein
VEVSRYVIDGGNESLIQARRVYVRRKGFFFGEEGGATRNCLQDLAEYMQQISAQPSESESEDERMPKYQPANRQVQWKRTGGDSAINQMDAR